jgi:hypothetical protein
VGGPSSYIELILACLLNMGEIEKGREAHLITDLILACPLNMWEIQEGREAHLITDLILACLLNMWEIEEGREAHPHIVLKLGRPPFLTGGGEG